MKAFFKRLGEWLMERLEEKSTYCGLAVLIGISGRHIPPEIMEAIDWWGAVHRYRAYRCLHKEPIMIPFLLSPLGKLAGIAMFAVSLLGAGALWLHNHDNDVRATMQAAADKAIAAQQAVDAEHEKAAVAAVASDAQRRAVAFTSIKDQTHAAPATSACASSPAVSALLNSLRQHTDGASPKAKR